MPPEFWKAICARHSPAVKMALQLCQDCWAAKEISEQWHLARIACIFKKGDETSCGNYRPISLLLVGYKLFASIPLKRLKDAGSDSRLWLTQFGFRARHSTGDALFIARRIIEEAWSSKDGSSLLLALDWAEAFDSISSESLATALHRFGIPIALVKMVEGIYKGCHFLVRDNGVDSRRRLQKFGICQSCPLPPYHFVNLMTTALHEAKAKLTANGVVLHDEVVCNDLVYADDTLLIDVHGRNLQRFMEAVQAIGGEAGLQFNWDKLELLQVRSDQQVSSQMAPP